MKSSYSEGGRLRLEFDTLEDGISFAKGIEQELGFMVSLTQRLALHHQTVVELVAGETAIEIGARVAQVFERGDLYNTAFLADEPSAVAPRLSKAASGATPHRSSGEEPAVGHGEVRGRSPMHKIKQMNPKQRSLLALKANRTERQILLRDNTPQVLQNLLNNPHLDSEEVLQIARSSHAVAPILQRIASETRWNANPEIITAVVRHPRTPSMVATRHLPALRTQDLRTMAKLSSGVREVLRKAALREYMRRTGQRI